MITVDKVRRLARRTVGTNTPVHKLWRKYKPVQKRSIGDVDIQRLNGAMVVSPPAATKTVGVYLYGGCDAERLLSIGPRVAPAVQERVALSYVGSIACSRIDLLLQKLKGVPTEDTAETLDRLNLMPTYFEPEIFEPTITDGQLIPTPVSKDAVVINLGAPVTRTIYRHKEKGFLVDPGGWWLSQSLDGVIPNRETMKWFRQNYKSIGRLGLEEWEVMFREFFTELTDRTHAHLIVLSLLTIEPGDPTHSYAGRKAPETVRRRRFHLRLMELSEELGFSVVDVDRLLKEEGVEGAVDFAHMPREHFGPVVDEAIHHLACNGVFTVDWDKYPTAKLTDNEMNGRRITA